MVIVTVMTAMAMAVMVHQARLRVVAERISAADLADHLVDEAIAALPLHAEDPLGQLDTVVGALPPLRHVRVMVLRSGMSAADPEEAQSTISGETAPEWFFDLLRPAPWEKRHVVMREGLPLGDVVILGNPTDEIAELWDEMLFGSGLLLGLMAVFIGVVFWLVSQALHPISLVSQGLDRLEQGDFAASLPPFNVAELKDVGEKFNSLARSLTRMSGDNRFLIQRLISLQESERNILAHELHDELGPCLFGIKAQAACIARPARGTAEEGHAKTILGLVDDLQRLNRRILGRLRPMALRDLGLAAAVGQLIDDWRGRVPEVDWQFHFSDFKISPDESLALSIYRVIQECLTNAARHSGATRVEVEIGPAENFKAGRLRWQGDPDRPVVYVAVRDNGRGVGGENRSGFGLLGIHERVEGCGGVVKVGGGEGIGAVVEALLPLNALSRSAGESHGRGESGAVGR